MVDRVAASGFPNMLPMVVPKFRCIVRTFKIRSEDTRAPGNHVTKAPWHDNNEVSNCTSGRRLKKSKTGFTLLGQEIPTLQFDTEQDTVRSRNRQGGINQNNVRKTLRLPNKRQSGMFVGGVPYRPQLVQCVDHLVLDGRAQCSAESEDICGADSLDIGITAKMNRQGAKRLPSAPPYFKPGPTRQWFVTRRCEWACACRRGTGFRSRHIGPTFRMRSKKTRG